MRKAIKLRRGCMNPKLSVVERREPTFTSDWIDVDTHEVKMRAYIDPELYEAEVRKIFGKAWLLVAHESEIPKVGDFVVRDMAGDRVIVSRDRNDQIHVMLNVCPHRGMRVCLPEEGNAPNFTCIYHGWSFRHDGSFLGTPIPRENMQGDMFAKEQLGLRKVRAQVYAGLVFATWDENAPSFEEWLGDYKFYFDIFMRRTDSGMEILGAPQKAIVDANWKSIAEQFAGDGFHTLTLHRSLLELGRIGSKTEGELSDKVSPAMLAPEVCANGHGARLLPAYSTLSSLIGKKPVGLDTKGMLEKLCPPGITQDLLPELYEHLTEDQLWIAAQYALTVGWMFPNIGFLWGYTQELDGTIVPRMAFHTLLPKGPNQLEFWTWMFAERDVPEAMKERMMQVAVQALGSTGMTEADDAETWPHVQAAARGPRGREETIKYQAISGENRPDDWPATAGGKVYNGFSKDDTQWNFWLRWKEMMDAPE
jgi:nitrite reductase/ring-hydroxylating ferredoxin subunit